MIVLRFPKQFENLICFLEKKWQAKGPWKLPRIFLEKNINFPGKSQDLDVLRLHKPEKLLDRFLKQRVHVESFWKFAKIFSKKTISLQKTLIFERLENPWVVVKFETHFDEKTCEIRRFRKFSLGFFKNDLSLFSKKNQTLIFSEKSMAVGIFGRPSRWNLPCLMFLKTCEDYFDHSKFFAKKNIFERFLSTLKH